MAPSPSVCGCIRLFITMSFLTSMLMLFARPPMHSHQYTAHQLNTRTTNTLLMNSPCLPSQPPPARRGRGVGRAAPREQVAAAVAAGRQPRRVRVARAAGGDRDCIHDTDTHARTYASFVHNTNIQRSVSLQYVDTQRRVTSSVSHGTWRVCPRQRSVSCSCCATSLCHEV